MADHSFPVPYYFLDIFNNNIVFVLCPTAASKVGKYGWLPITQNVTTCYSEFNMQQGTTEKNH